MWRLTCKPHFPPLFFPPSVDPSSAMMSVDMANRNGPLATPPSSLSLRSSHNQLLSCDVLKQGSATLPKCRMKYALTSLQSAMGLGEAPPTGTEPPPASSTSSNPKLAKNGANQMRKAAEQQDCNKNIDNGNGAEDTAIISEGKENQAPPRRSKSFLEYYGDDHTGQECNANVPQTRHELPTPPKQSSPEDVTLLSEASSLSSSSSASETKKDRPRTGAKTDCALNRIQNLAPSDEDSSWTTLSQDSASLSSPEEAGEQRGSR